MKRFTLLFCSLFLMMAFPLRATLEYLQYTIADGSTSVPATPADGIEALALNTADKILFVRRNMETSDYYIAVFELTHAQAAKLGWTSGVDETSPAAFGKFESSGKHPLTLPLAYPTAEQWKAYVQEKPEKNCNMRGGFDDYNSVGKTVEVWYSDYISEGKSAINDYGLYDTFGNVAECTIEENGTVQFQGWYSGTSETFGNITRDTATRTLSNLLNAVSSVAGVRPIYIPPAAQTYTVTVKLDGAVVETQTKIKPEAEVTIAIPTPSENYRLNDNYTVTPSDLEIATRTAELAFKMPTANVEFNFTSSPVAIIAVEGGSTSKANVCSGEEFTITANETALPFLNWVGPGITEENKTTNPLTLKVDTLTAGETLTYTANFDKRIKIEVVNGTASAPRVEKGETVTITASDAWADYSYWKGDYGITDSNKKDRSITITIPNSLADGATLTYTAILDPRVTINVIGGTASATKVEKGKTVTLTADTNPYKSFSYWQEGVSGITNTTKWTTPLTITIPESLEDNATLTYTAVFVDKIKIVVNGGTASKAYAGKGEQVTLTAPATWASYSYWKGDYGITDSNKKGRSITITIPDSLADGATLTYTAILDPRVSISVIGGTASPMLVEKGASVKLTAKGKAWQCFSSWTGDYAITSTNETKNPLEITIGTDVTDSANLSYAAVFTNHPRVLVFGGTASPDNTANSYGNGYYKAGTKLTLTPHDSCPDGYVFSHWVNQSGTKLSGNSYTVGANNTEVTLSAVYSIDTTVAAATPMYIGVVSESDLTTNTAFGYVATSPSRVTNTYNDGKNTIYYYGTQEPSSDYAQLVFSSNTINYTSVDAASANSEANRKTALVLKRVKPSSGQPYYVGIHEVTNAQYDAVMGTTTSGDPLLPHATFNSTRGEASSFLTKLSTLFVETFKKPTKTQIQNISTGALNNTGTYGDKNITDAMVNCENDGKKALEQSGAQKVDPYGFYDLWGNAAESFDGDTTNLWGGYWNTYLNYCNLAQATVEASVNAPGAIRAAITVPARYTVTVANLNKSFAVLPGQKITLKEQVKPGCKFTGWKVTTGNSTTTYTSVPKTITVNANTTITALFSNELQSITLKYSGGISGPSTAFPGTTINVFPTEPNVNISTLSVSSSTAATVNATSKTITFKETASGTVTITATVSTPEAGFQFKLR